MIDIDEAQRIVEAHVTPLPSEEVPLSTALHGVLAASVVCDVDSPPFDRSVMDGYAVRAADVAAAPVSLRVVGSLAAGRTSDQALSSGEAMQINTGAPLPPGADAVVRVELTQLENDGGRVLIERAVDAGQFITRRATYTTAGSVVLASGTRLTPLDIGVAATAGAGCVTVHRRPVVGILPTGDELIDIERTPVGAEIRNSNQPLLVAAVRAEQAEPVALEPVGDDKVALERAIRRGLNHDVLCLTGGISMGTYDFVPEVLESCGVAFHFRKLAIKPGRPTIFGTTADGTLVFALPGNPMSAFIGFELLVKPALWLLRGYRRFPAPVSARLVGRISANAARRSYRPATAHVDNDGHWSVEPVSWHGSGDSIGTANANALIVRPPEAPAVEPGEAVSVILLDRC